MIKKLPSLKEIEKKFFYDNGRLFYRENVTTWVKAGDEAGCVHKNTGYHSVTIGGQRYQTHRIIWKMFNRKEPVGEIDHINGDRTDNRIENLRLVSKSENLKNQRTYKNNKSGMPGVYWNTQKNKWCVQVTSEGIQKYYGCFESLDDAKKVRIDAQKDFNFHSNHGRI